MGFAGQRVVGLVPASSAASVAAHVQWEGKFCLHWFSWPCAKLLKTKAFHSATLFT